MSYYDHEKESAKELYENRLITDVLKKKKSLLISFSGTDNKLKLIADTDCCDVSWFELYPESEVEYECMIDRMITTIYVSEEIIKLPPSGRQKCDKNKIVVIEFDDETQFKFILRNSSNGYYSSSLRIEVIDSDGDRI